MAAEAEVLCQQSVSVQYLCVSATPIDADLDLFEVSTPTINKPHIFCPADSAVSCSTSAQTTAAVDPAKSSSFVPIIRSGSHTDIGPRRTNEDEHIRVDDLSVPLGSLYNWPLPGAFYAVFDGHGGSDAAAYIKNNAMRLFFEDADLPQTSAVNQAFLEELVNSHSRAFLLADHWLMNLVLMPTVERRQSLYWFWGDICLLQMLVTVVLSFVGRGLQFRCLKITDLLVCWNDKELRVWVVLLNMAT